MDDLTYSPEEVSQSSFGLRSVLVVLAVALLAGAVGMEIQKGIDREKQQAMVNRKEKFAEAVDQLQRSHLELGYYLLSGDPRTVQDIEQDQRGAAEALKELSAFSPGSVPISKLIACHADWKKTLANPLIAHRQEVDSGHASVAELQIHVLQLDPMKWERDCGQWETEARQALAKIE